MKKDSIVEVKALVNKGVEEFNKKHFESALRYYKKALKLSPNFLIALSNIVATYNQMGKFDVADMYLKKTLILDSNNYLVLFNAGHNYYGKKDYKRAIGYFEQVLKINKNLADAYLLLGICYAELMNHQEAIKVYKQGLNIYPQHPAYLNNLAKIYIQIGEKKKAISIYEQIVKTNPEMAYVYANLASTYFQINDYVSSRKYLKKVFKLEPNNFEARMLSANIYDIEYKYSDAISEYVIARKLKPNDPQPIIGLYNQYRNVCNWEQAEKIERLPLFAQGAGVFTLLQAFDDPKQELIAAKREAVNIASKVRHTFAPRAITGEHKKRIGILSADLKNHPVGQLMESYFKYYDRNKFELFIYSLGQDDESSYRQVAENASSNFNDLFGVSDLQVAERIYNDNLDILIDLMGYTQAARPQILAMRPALVQVLYLGFPGTSGAGYIDYLVADKTVIPERYAKYYKEKILYLPSSFMPIGEARLNLAQNVTREEYGLPKDAIIFCTFCGASKIDRRSFLLWMEILKKTPNSILLLRESEQTVSENIRRAAVDSGVRRERIIFAKRVPNKQEHLARLSLVDIALDTLIYGGHTTTIDFVLAGVPVITKIGKHFAGRVAASILRSFGLEQFVVSTEKKYVNLAVKMANDTKKLNQLKQRMRKMIEKSKYIQSKTYVASFENKLLACLRTTRDS